MTCLSDNGCTSIKNGPLNHYYAIKAKFRLVFLRQPILLDRNYAKSRAPLNHILVFPRGDELLSNFGSCEGKIFLALNTDELVLLF